MTIAGPVLGCTLASALIAAALAAPAPAAKLPICGSMVDGERVLGTYSVAQGERTTLRLDRRPHGRVEVRINVDGCQFERRANGEGAVYELLANNVYTSFVSDSGAEISPPTDQSKNVSEGTDKAEDLPLKMLLNRTGKTSASLFLELTSRKGVEPGTYRGNVLVDVEEELGHEMTLPMEITVQYPRWWIVALITGLPAFLVGVLLLWAKSVQSQPASQPLKPWTWVWSVPTLVAIGAGVGSAIGVWFKEYWNDSTWGAQQIEDYWILFGLLLAAFTAVSTGLSTGFDHARAQGRKEATALKYTATSAGSATDPEP